MKEKLKLMLADKVMRNCVISFAALIVLFGIIGLLKYKSLPPQLPLYYSLPRGDDQLGTPKEVLFLPVVSIVFFIVNFTCAFYLYTQRKFAAILFILIGTIIPTILFIAYLKIIFLISF